MHQIPVVFQMGGADTLDAVVNAGILTQKEKSPNANRVQTQSGRGGHFRCRQNAGI